MDISEAQSLWDPNPGWLNTASYGLPPRPAWEALQRALADWRIGATSWEPWDESTGRARAAFARLVGADPADVFVGSTVSAAMALIAAEVPDGGQVLVPEEEFSSNVFPWAVHEDRGVTVRTAPADRLLEAIEPDDDVVALSAVQSATGVVADLDPIIHAAREIGALVVVDATQAVGWLPIRVTEVDALVASTYKWMMSPRGTTFGYLAPALRARLRPAQAGWYAGQDPHTSYYGLPLRLASDARAFDQSPAWFGLVGAAPTLELIERIGVETIRQHNVALANHFLRGLGLPESDSAIVSADAPGADSSGDPGIGDLGPGARGTAVEVTAVGGTGVRGTGVEERLAVAGVHVAVRGGRLRASFHVYTTEADVDLALDALLSSR